MTRTMRRWTARLAGGVIALSGLGLVGCKHQLFTEPADSPALRRPNIPPQLEDRPHDPILPAAAAIGSDPATVIDLKRQPRPISLKEAIAIAVEQGNTGGGVAQFGGAARAQETPLAAGANGTDTIKAFVLDPSIAYTNLERSLSKFDARWITSMNWGKQDQATLNTIQQGFSNGDTASFLTTLAKPLPTGGVAGITTTVNYLSLSNPPQGTQFQSLSTAYTPRVQFVFEQPLLQGFGVEANQLLPNHPGSLLVQGFRSTGQGTDGILLTRVRVAQSHETFNIQLNTLLINVEAAYWDLYAAYYNLFAVEEGLKAAFSALDFNKPRVEKGVEEPQLLPQLEQNYWNFYAQVIDARGRLLEADRTFRALLGLRSDDGTIFTPSDDPVKAPVRIDFKAAYEEGLQTRPDILFNRQELKLQQLNLRAQRLARMADLRFFSSYDVNGLGPRLFGGADSAAASLANNQFNSWQLGLRLEVPLGFRDANALVRQAQENMWRAWYALTDSERKLHEMLVAADRDTYQRFQLIEANRRTRLAARRRVELINTRIQAGQFQGGSAYLQLTSAQQELANATAAEFQAVADYNKALARIEYAKGTIQRYNNVNVTEGPLPAFVQKKAADHFRERQAGFKLREHPADPTATGNIGGFQFAPVGQMTDQLPVGGPPASGPPALVPPMAAPAAGNPVKSWGDWPSTQDGTGVSLPSSLPPLNTPRPATGGDPSATFTPKGSLGLPTRPPAPVEVATEPPRTVPATVPGIPALPPIK